MMNLDRIKELDRQVQPSDELLAGEREGLAAIYAQAKAEGIVPAAFKAARRLASKSQQDVRAWLTTFNATIAALGLDAQLDLEEAIAEAKAEPKSARQAVENIRAMVRADGGGDFSLTGPDGSGVKITADAVESIPPRERVNRGRGTLN